MITVLQSGPGFEVFLEAVKAATGVLLTVMVGIVGYYLRKEYTEHRKNTAVRRYLVGDPALEEVEDEGELDELDDRFDTLESRIEDVQQAVDEIAHLLEREHDEQITRPDGGVRGDD